MQVVVDIIYLYCKDPEETANSVYLLGNGLGIQTWKTTLTFVFYLPECLNICTMSIYYFQLNGVFNTGT